MALLFFSKTNDKGDLIESGELNRGQYFGELALTKGTERAATIKAHTNLTCLELTKEDFDDLLKPLSDIFAQRALEYTRIASETYRSLSCVSVDDQKNVSLEDDVIPTIETPLEKFKKLGLLGKGAFGLVTFVADPNSAMTFALKAIRKHDIVEHEQVEHIVNEKNIQMSLRSPFCVKLFRTYKDKYRVYLLLEACTGGDIFTILRKQRRFPESTARFYAGCIIAAFDHMHARDIIYRDLKPENLVLNESGYAKITDFGFAKKVEGKTNTVCGTPDYLAPEVIVGSGHGKGVDFWTLGVFMFECINGQAPFYAKKDMDRYRKILRSSVSFTKRMSKESKDIITKLLRKRPTKRLGIRKGQDVHDQDFFKKAEWDWPKFLKQEATPPILPKKVALKNANVSRYKVFNKDIECPFQEFEKEF